MRTRSNSKAFALWGFQLLKNLDKIGTPITGGIGTDYK
jgi:hypothetical protein